MQNHSIPLSSVSADDEADGYFSRITSNPAVILFIIYLLAMTLRLEAAFKHNIIYPDEFFQTLEPAHRLAFGYGVTTWEWRDGIRSWIVPAVLAGLMRIGDWILPSSGGYLLIIYASLILSSLTTVWFAYAWTKRTYGATEALVAAGSCAVWYSLVNFSVSALTEVFATNLLLPGLYLGTIESPKWRSTYRLASGICCGIAMCLRFQLAPAIIFVMAYFCWKKPWSDIRVTLGGFAIPLAGFGIVDWVTWSYPFSSIAKYVLITVVHGKSKIFGTEPWYWYLIVIALQFGPMLYLIVLAARRNGFLLSVSALIIGSHTLISHKEMRFLYPSFPILVLLSGIGVVILLKDWRRWNRLPLSLRVFVGVGVIYFLSLCLASNFQYWDQNSGAMTAFDHLRSDPELCGVAVYGVNLFATGGYSRLHRQVPILIPGDKLAMESDLKSVDALVASNALKSSPPGFNRQGCWNEICLYKKDGPCVSLSNKDEVNRRLRAEGN